MRKNRSKPPRGGRRVAALLCALLLALSAAACGGDSTEDTSQDSIVEDGGAPAIEDTDAEEEAEDSANEAVAVELPGLPIGGNAIAVSETLQCADVGWSAPPDLPAWVSITVTGVAFAPPDGFAASSESCPGDAPPCLESGVQLTASDRCYVAVTWTGPTLDSERTMSFTSGRLTCQPDRVDECEDFRDEVEAEGPKSIGLDPAPWEFETDENSAEENSAEENSAEENSAEENSAEENSAEDTDPDQSADDSGG